LLALAACSFSACDSNRPFSSISLRSEYLTKSRGKTSNICIFSEDGQPASYVDTFMLLFGAAYNFFLGNQNSLKYVPNIT
jgi:hypothetical protein